MSSEAIGAVYALQAISTARRLRRLNGVEELLLLYLADAWDLRQSLDGPGAQIGRLPFS